MMIVLKIIGVSMLASNGLTMYSTKEEEGFPVGLVSDCPGTTKKAKILKKYLHFLQFNVLHDGNILTAKMNRYNYHQMAELARDTGVDFKRKKTLVFCVGYLDSPNIWPISVATVFGTVYKRLGYNVLLLEANRFITVVYPVAARFLRPAGKHVAEMLVNLTKFGLDPKRTHIAGISLGGQALSFIAKSFYNQTGVKIGRITALDPSGPCFRHLGPNDRLDRSDADFVEVIHTNIDGFGIATPVGHVNFYINGGEFQPGAFSMMPCDSFCSHARAYTLWISALLHPDIFIGIQCDSVQQARDRKCFDRQPRVTNLMGPKTDKNKTGIFYLATGNAFPYGLGKKGLSKENEPYTSQLRWWVDDYGDTM